MKYHALYEELKRRITTTEFALGKPLPHISALAKTHACAEGTVKRALRLLQMEGLVYGVKSKGTFVRDPGLPLLRMPRNEKKNVGVLTLAMLGALGDPYYATFLNGMEQQAKDHANFQVVRCRNLRLQEILRVIHALHLDAIVTIEFDDRLLRREIERLPIPVVHADQYDTQSKRPLVLPDYMQGGRLTVETLVAQGHRKMIYLYPYYPLFQNTNRANVVRWKGIREAMRRFRVSCSFQRLYLKKSEDIVPAVRVALEKHDRATGIIVPSGQILNNLNTLLSTWEPGKTNRYGIVAFSHHALPMRIHGKPVSFCTWDNGRLGRIAVDIALGGGDPEQRIRYLPMFIRRET